MVRNRRKKRFSKHVLPFVLVVALLFSTVMSVGYASWSDTLTIDSSVRVAKAPLKVTVAPRDKDTASSAFLENPWEAMRDQESKNWMTYQIFTASSYRTFLGLIIDVVEYVLFWYLPGVHAPAVSYSVEAYEIASKWEEEKSTFTIYNPYFTADKGYTPSASGSSSTATDTFGGKYSYYGRRYGGSFAVPTIQFPSNLRPLDPSPYGNSNSQGYAPAKTPLTITLTNTNTSAVNLTGISINPSNAASYDLGRDRYSRPITLPQTISAGGTYTIPFDVKTTEDFTITFTTDDPDNPTIPVYIDFTSGTPAMMSPPRLTSSRPPVSASAPTNNGEDSTTDGTEPTGDSTESTAPTSDSTTESTTASTSESSTEDSTESTSKATTASTEAETTTEATTEASKDDSKDEPTQAPTEPSKDEPKEEPTEAPTEAPKDKPADKPASKKEPEPESKPESAPESEPAPEADAE